jgi:hypothetical protein
MFMRGQIGPCPQWLTELDVGNEVAAIEENWIKTGKMLSWHNISDGYPIIGPKLFGAGENEGLTLWVLHVSEFPAVQKSGRWVLPSMWPYTPSYWRR